VTFKYLVLPEITFRFYYDFTKHEPHMEINYSHISFGEKLF
jgi:hypothetical protein